MDLLSVAGSFLTLIGTINDDGFVGKKIIRDGEPFFQQIPVYSLSEQEIGKADAFYPKEEAVNYPDVSEVGEIPQQPNVFIYRRIGEDNIDVPGQAEDISVTYLVSTVDSDYVMENHLQSSNWFVYKRIQVVQVKVISTKEHLYLVDDLFQLSDHDSPKSFKNKGYARNSKGKFSLF